MEFLSDLRIESDHHIILLIHLVVSLHNSAFDPMLERLSDDGRTDIDEPLLRNLGQVDVVRQIELDVRVSRAKHKDLVDGERLVVRHIEVLHIVDMESSFSAAAKIT